MQIRRDLALLLDVIEARHNTDGYGFLVGVHESATCDALGAIAHDGVGGTLVLVQVEAFANATFPKLDDGLDAHRQILFRFAIAQPLVLANEGVDAVSRDNHARLQFVLTCADANVTPIFLDQRVDLDARHHGHARFFALPRKPRIELGP